MQHPFAPKRLTRYCLPGLLLILGGCVYQSYLQPILSLAPYSCRARPDLTDAKDLSLLSQAKEVQIVFDEKTPCAHIGKGDKSAYIVFKIPPILRNAILTVVSSPRDQVLLSPRVLLLNRQGNIVREIPQDSFMFRGSGASLAVSIHLHQEEEYLIIASDPKAIGRREVRLENNVDINTVSTGYRLFSLLSGSEKTNIINYAHNGFVFLSLRGLSLSQGVLSSSVSPPLQGEATR